MPTIEMLTEPRNPHDLVDGSMCDATAADHTPTEQSGHTRLVGRWTADPGQALSLQWRLVANLVG